MEEIQLKAKLINGRLVIESIDEQSSISLSKWIDDNKQWLDKRLDIEILAH